jgi:hypothetical protein
MEKRSFNSLLTSTLGKNKNSFYVDEFKIIGETIATRAK